MTGSVQKSTGGRRRLLLPICACEESRWGIGYARQLQRAGQPVEAILLNVGEPVRNLHVPRFRTQQEIEAFQASRAQCFIDEASRQLASDGIACRGVFKQGEIVFSILDTAEELDCDEVVMPAQASGLCALFSRSKADAVRRQQRLVPVVLIDRQGTPR